MSNCKAVGYKALGVKYNFTKYVFICIILHFNGKNHNFETLHRAIYSIMGFIMFIKGLIMFIMGFIMCIMACGTYWKSRSSFSMALKRYRAR